MSLKYTKFGAYMRQLFNPFSYLPLEKNISRGMNMINTNSLEGDYAEFGVWEGYSFIKAYYFAKIHQLENMRFYAFDSFNGHPETELNNEKPSWLKGVECSCSQDNFKKNLIKQNVNLNQVKCIEGWFKDTLKKDKSYGIKKLAFVYIDCDIYSSVKLVLDYIKPYLQNGTVILFSNWYCINAENFGEQGAFREFEKNNPDISFYEASDYLSNQKIFYCVKNNKEGKK